MRMIEAINERLNAACWRRLDLRWRLRSGVEIAVRSRAEWVIYNDIFVEGEYDEPLRRAIADCPPGQDLRILDLGANVGYFGLRAFDRVAAAGPRGPRIMLTMVEGSPAVFNELQQRMRQPRCDGGVHLVSGLAGHRTGSAEIVQGPFHVENRVVKRRQPGTVTVAYVDLDALLDPGAVVDLLKCDIEGGEQDLIGGYPALLARTRRAVFELHPGKCDVPHCLAALERAGLTSSLTLRETPQFSVRLFENPRLRRG